MAENISGVNVRNVNSQQVQKSKNSKLRTAGAITAGGLVGVSGIVAPVVDSFKKVTPEMAQETASSMKLFLPNVETSEQTTRNILKLLKDTGLKDKGVEFLSVMSDGSNADKLKDVIDRNVKPTNWLNRRMNNSYFNIFKKGANAAFLSDTNHIVVHENLCSTAYHELGHALNANGNIFVKAFQKSRAITPMGMSLVAPLVLAVGLFHNVDKTKPEKQKGFMEKTADFMKNHAGALTLASYIPLLGEEGLASIRGVQQARKVASKDAVKGLIKNYTKAWGTYALVAGIVTTAVTLGIAISDKIKQKKSA